MERTRLLATSLCRNVNVRQTLFYIPHEILGLPAFGVGWLLFLWGALAIGWIVWSVKKSGWSSEVKELLPFLLVTGIAIVWVLPHLEARAPDGTPLGLPIRGYGTLLLLGVISGWGLAAWRAGQRGLSLDSMVSLGWRVLIVGIVSARLFFVIEYWSEFQQPTWGQTVAKIIQFTEGGLVVYGSLIGGFVAFVWFARQKRLSIFALGDIIAPGVVLGMAIGRIGCLMNGCCYGGECHRGAWSIQFPRYSSIQQEVISPPYGHQLTTGRLHGFLLGHNEFNQPLVRAVDPNGPAENAGLVAGVRIASLNRIPTPNRAVAEEVLANSGPDISLELADGQVLKWNIGKLPDRSRPVHPSQIYGAISGFLICFLLLVSEPFFNRRGATMTLLLTVYPIVRFLEEMIRDDEPAQWGTALTISQLISLFVLVAALVTWYFVFRGARPPHRSAADPATA